MRYLYKKCLCVVIPLKYNEHVSGNTTLLEAVAMKKAAIISNIPGIDDYITKDKTGILVDVGDVEGFVRAVQFLDENRNYAEQMGENAYLYCKERFTTDIWAKEHAKLTYELFIIKVFIKIGENYGKI